MGEECQESERKKGGGKVRGHQRLTKHHRKPKSLGGNSLARNISKVPFNHHAAWHQLFNDDTPEEIVKRINEVWLDPDYMLVIARIDQPK